MYNSQRYLIKLSVKVDSLSNSFTLIRKQWGYTFQRYLIKLSVKIDNLSTFIRKIKYRHHSQVTITINLKTKFVFIDTFHLRICFSYFYPFRSLSKQRSCSIIKTIATRERQIVCKSALMIINVNKLWLENKYFRIHCIKLYLPKH